MKTRSIIFGLIVVLFSSCLVKSLNPFYTPDTISFNEDLLGKWKDNKGAQWEIRSFKELIHEDYNIDREINGVEVNGSVSIEEPISGEEKEFYEKYKNAYYVNRTYKEKEAGFLVVPFTIKNQLFLDFIPFDFESEEGSLTDSHLVAAHSLVKIDFTDDKSFSIRWLDEDRLEDLFKKNKIKIKHQKNGFVKDNILLTAKSEELQKFIRKYMASNIKDKWKTDTQYTLTRDYTKP